ncbi:hypothetical protein Scep_017233 [Stephania cephalantha]|uniref:t-SNARE coiled-coil homology domain-containing protein n=1 Tax=Stephania cephalantha TaxID=152367 RepID=A0AAP0NVG5_9MAGN
MLVEMLDFMKSPLRKVVKGNSPAFPASSSTNPLDSDSEDDAQKNFKPSRKASSEPVHGTPIVNPSRRTSSEPVLGPPISKTNPFDYDDDEEEEETVGPSSSSSSSSISPYRVTAAARNQYKNDFCDSGGVENQTVQELENYALYKAEETTKSVNASLKIAGDIREDASKTLVTLHQQGEQITRTHMNAADIDHDLSRGEKLLGSLGGIFSKTWKPKKTREITGPFTLKDHAFSSRPNHLEQRDRLGLSSTSKQRQSSPRRTPPEPTTTLQKVEVEENKQDDALNEISNILDELKDMAIDMGAEIGRQNKALDPFHDDVDELSFRIKGANQRGRRLLRK